MTANVFYYFAGAEIAGALDPINVEATPIVAKVTVSLNEPGPEIDAENGDVAFASFPVRVDIGDSQFRDRGNVAIDEEIVL
nr:hypothetical protein [Paraburkholderia tropica]